MEIRDTAKRMRELAENAKENEREEVSVTFTPKDIKVVTGWDRTSARREIQLGDELKSKGWGHRNSNGTFTVFSGDGWRSLSFVDAVKAETELND